MCLSGLLGVCYTFVVMATASACSDVAYSPHPSLFFDCWDVPVMQYKARTSHRVIAARIIRAMETVKASPEDYLPPRNHKAFAAKSVVYIYSCY